MKKLLLLSYIVCILSNCSSDDSNDDGTPLTDLTAPSVSLIIARDIADNGDGSDLEISFNKVSDETLLSEYRVYVVKTAEISSFDLVKAESITENNYLSLNADGTDKIFTLKANSNDVNGDLITESVSYVVFVLSVADGVNATSNSLSSSSSTVILEQPVIRAATNVRMLDIANSGDAGDIEITFSLSSIENISELRVLVVKGGQSSSFDLSTAEAVASGNYANVTVSDRKIRLSNAIKDTDGDNITEGVSYVGFILSVADQSLGIANVLSGSSGFLTLQRISAVSTLTSNIPGGSGGMDVDAAGNIYMADFGANLSGSPGTRVFKVTPSGTVSVFASGLVGASGNDFDASGNLIQSNIGAGTVSRITPNGTVSQLASGFSSPVGVTVDQNGDFYVCNCGANSISKVTNNGANVTTFVTSSLMSCPNGIDMDVDGNLYVANFSSSNLVKITPDGQASVMATLPGNNNGHLLINGDFIYVISRGLHQIHRVTFDGNVSLFAGSGTRGIINGPLTQAGFSFPNDLAFSPDGTKMYVNDVNAGNDSNVLTPVAIRVIDIVE